MLEDRLCSFHVCVSREVVFVLMYAGGHVRSQAGVRCSNVYLSSLVLGTNIRLSKYKKWLLDHIKHRQNGKKSFLW